MLVALVAGAVPELAHPSELHLAGTSPDGRLAALISDERLARRLRALGYDPSRLGGMQPEDGASARSTRASSTRPAGWRAPRSARTRARVTAGPEAPSPT